MRDRPREYSVVADITIRVILDISVVTTMTLGREQVDISNQYRRETPQTSLRLGSDEIQLPLPTSTLSETPYVCYFACECDQGADG